MAFGCALGRIRLAVFLSAINKSCRRRCAVLQPQPHRVRTTLAIAPPTACSRDCSSYIAAAAASSSDSCLMRGSRISPGSLQPCCSEPAAVLAALAASALLCSESSAHRRSVRSSSSSSSMPKPWRAAARPTHRQQQQQQRRQQPRRCRPPSSAVAATTTTRSFDVGWASCSHELEPAVSLDAPVSVSRGAERVSLPGDTRTHAHSEKERLSRGFRCFRGRWLSAGAKSNGSDFRNRRYC